MLFDSMGNLSKIINYIMLVLFAFVAFFLIKVSVSTYNKWGLAGGALIPIVFIGLIICLFVIIRAVLLIIKDSKPKANKSIHRALSIADNFSLIFLFVVDLLLLQGLLNFLSKGILPWVVIFLVLIALVTFFLVLQIKRLSRKGK